MDNNRYIKDQYKREVDEAAIYRDAWHIVDPGAVNPTAIASTLAAMSSALMHSIGTDGVRAHPACRIVAGQLAMLFKVDSLGGDIEDYNKVREYLDTMEAKKS